jgi:hypothetical protein
LITFYPQRTAPHRFFKSQRFTAFHFCSICISVVEVVVKEKKMTEDIKVEEKGEFEPVKFDPEANATGEKKSGVMGSGGTIDLNALKNLDPELSKLCSELDLDGDGTINAAELTRACGVIRETRDESAEWQKAAFRRLIAIVVLLTINLVLIGTVTYYIVWSTAAVRVDENGNLVNFHEGDDGEATPAPVAAQQALESKSGLDDLFETAEYNKIDMLAYSDANGAQFIRPTGFSVFERTVDGSPYDTVVAYVDGSTAIVVENKIQDPYVIDPKAPYTISGIEFGKVNADSTQLESTFARRQLLSEARPESRKLAKGKSASDAAKKAESKKMPAGKEAKKNALVKPAGDKKKGK